MDVRINEAQTARLTQIAESEGKTVGDLLIEAATSILQLDQRHLEAVDRAIGQIDRGEFIEEEEMNARIEKMLAR